MQMARHGHDAWSVSEKTTVFTKTMKSPSSECHPLMFNIRHEETFQKRENVISVPFLDPLW